MMGPIARYRALRAAGVLGLNQRNADYVLPKNARRYYPRVDNKLITKQLAEERSIPVPPTLGVITHHHELRHLPRLVAGRTEFVLKPARGSQGNGIVVITGVERNGFVKSSGALVTMERLRQHVSSVISGIFSLRGDWDSCLIETRIVLHHAFADMTRYGIPDVRVIVYRGIPVMAMCRLPTGLSDGRANLHQGAIGVGIDIASGRAVHAALHNHAITHHVDTHAPILDLEIPGWNELLLLAARASEISGLGYVGVDVVIDEVRGPLLLELNARPGLAIQLANNEGLAPRLRKVDRLPVTAASTPEERCALAQELFGRFAPVT